ncbi:hypothetical protein [Burkholderia stabilis]|uniref:hypothetical protein n=1 Tax=Burkholderia stabilis TaxID=95485 RepID=UPI001588D4C3|nr:hypothetical protein [Burkholderia stabilis]
MREGLDVPELLVCFFDRRFKLRLVATGNSGSRKSMRQCYVRDLEQCHVASVNDGKIATASFEGKAGSDLPLVQNFNA